MKNFITKLFLSIILMFLLWLILTTQLDGYWIFAWSIFALIFIHSLFDKRSQNIKPQKRGYYIFAPFILSNLLTLIAIISAIIWLNGYQTIFGLALNKLTLSTLILAFVPSAYFLGSGFVKSMFEQKNLA